MKLPRHAASQRMFPCAPLKCLLPVLALLLACMLAGCGGVGGSAMKVADGFFDAVANEDPAELRGLLDEADRQDFEAAMSDAELADYLAQANSALTARYGAGWRKRITMISANAGQAGADGIPWSVTVSLGETAEDRQTVPVMEREGTFWLDLSWASAQQ